jgi:hypothetical protein
MGENTVGENTGRARGKGEGMAERKTAGPRSRKTKEARARLCFESVRVEERVFSTVRRAPFAAVGTAFALGALVGAFPAARGALRRAASWYLLGGRLF